MGNSVSEPRLTQHCHRKGGNHEQLETGFRGFLPTDHSLGQSVPCQNASQALERRGCILSVCLWAGPSSPNVVVIQEWTSQC